MQSNFTERSFMDRVMRIYKLYDANSEEYVKVTLTDITDALSAGIIGLDSRSIENQSVASIFINEFGNVGLFDLFNEDENFWASLTKKKEDNYRQDLTIFSADTIASQLGINEFTFKRLIRYFDTEDFDWIKWEDPTDEHCHVFRFSENFRIALSVIENQYDLQLFKARYGLPSGSGKLNQDNALINIQAQMHEKYQEQQKEQDLKAKQKSEVYKLSNAGVSIDGIAKQLGMRKITIFNIIERHKEFKERFQQIESLHDVVNSEYDRLNAELDAIANETETK